MVNHIAFYRFKKDLTESDKRIASVKLKKGFENLSGKIRGLKAIRVENILLDSSNIDLVVVAEFETKQDVNDFHNSPLFFNFKNTMESSLEKTYIADYIQ